MDQDLHFHTNATDLIESLDELSEVDKVDTDNGMKILTKIAELKKRAKCCMSPGRAANISTHLKAMGDEAWHA